MTVNGREIKPGADLWSCRYITSFRGGVHDRECFIVFTEKTPLVNMGCFWGTVKEAQKVIREKYGENSLYEQAMMIAVEQVKALREDDE